MTAIEKKYLILLRVFLVGAAIAWGVSVFGLILPWAMVDAELVKRQAFVAGMDLCGMSTHQDFVDPSAESGKYNHRPEMKH